MSEILKVIYGAGVSIVSDDFKMNKIIGIKVDGDQLRAVATMDEDSKMEFKMELIRKFQERLETIF